MRRSDLNSPTLTLSCRRDGAQSGGSLWRVAIFISPRAAGCSSSLSGALSRKPTCSARHDAGRACPGCIGALSATCRVRAACALRRAAFGETLEYSNDLGLYPRVGLGLHTRGYACWAAFVCCRCGLRARVRDPSFVCAARIVAFERLELECPVDLEAHLGCT